MKNLYTFIALIASSGVYAQCYPDRHNTSWNEGWISCTPNDNPVPERGLSHWVRYDFGNTYRLGNIHMWNLNDNKRLGAGFNDFVIDYSTDGENWKSLGQLNIAKASGQSTYEGETVGSFGGDTARFVVVTALSNWGGNCAGFAEIKFQVLEVTQQISGQYNNECFSVSVFPNPHIEAFNFAISTRCTGPLDYSLYDSMGRLVNRGNMPPDMYNFTETVYTESLAPGMYHLVISQEGKVSRQPLIKVQR